MVFGRLDIRNKVILRARPGMYILAGGGYPSTRANEHESIEAVSNATSIATRIMILSTHGPGCPSIPNQCQGDVPTHRSAGLLRRGLERRDL